MARNDTRSQTVTVATKKYTCPTCGWIILSPIPVSYCPRCRTGSFPRTELLSRKPGPGTHLSRLIAKFQRVLPWWDMQRHSGCGCNDTARWMDQLGPYGCETHLDAIVDRLEAEATRREIKFPFRRAAAKRMVRWAIRRARKSI